MDRDTLLLLLLIALLLAAMMITVLWTPRKSRHGYAGAWPSPLQGEVIFSNRSRPEIVKC